MLLEEAPPCIRDLDVEDPIVLEQSPGMFEHDERLSDVLKHVAERDHVERSVLRRGNFVNETVVDEDSMLSREWCRRGRGFHSRNVPTTRLHQPKEHSGVAPDVKKSSSIWLVPLD